jgi:hypothetical protein
MSTFRVEMFAGGARVIARDVHGSEAESGWGAHFGQAEAAERESRIISAEPIF